MRSGGGGGRTSREKFNISAALGVRRDDDIVRVLKFQDESAWTGVAICSSDQNIQPTVPFSDVPDSLARLDDYSRIGVCLVVFNGNGRSAYRLKRNLQVPIEGL